MKNQQYKNAIGDSVRSDGAALIISAQKLIAKDKRGDIEYRIRRLRVHKAKAIEEKSATALIRMQSQADDDFNRIKNKKTDFYNAYNKSKDAYSKLMTYTSKIAKINIERNQRKGTANFNIIKEYKNQVDSMVSEGEVLLNYVNSLKVVSDKPSTTYVDNGTNEYDGTTNENSTDNYGIGIGGYAGEGYVPEPESNKTGLVILSIVGVLGIITAVILVTRNKGKK